MSAKRQVKFKLLFYQTLPDGYKVTLRTEEHIGFFHTWGLEMDDETKTSYSVGLVENLEGKMFVVSPVNITFTENLSYLADPKPL